MKYYIQFNTLQDLMYCVKTSTCSPSQKSQIFSVT